MYLIPFLHQTTTLITDMVYTQGCILFHFYIKPQQLGGREWVQLVVSYSISTSNHNTQSGYAYNPTVVSYSISTSNHNCLIFSLLSVKVVSYSISTSNHNIVVNVIVPHQLYLIPFLHQTTTIFGMSVADGSCILFHFYIKPQHKDTKQRRMLSCILFHFYIKPQPICSYGLEPRVVSYSISTSNHNYSRPSPPTN